MKLSILILNAPCEGFGDIIFAMKLAHYIKKWYNINPYIASTKSNSFIELGFKKDRLFHLSSKKEWTRFKYIDFPKDLPSFDVYLVGPIHTGTLPILSDISSKIENATKTNTFFFSEYNDRLNKEFDFNTGIGEGRDGMFLDTFIEPSISPSQLIKNLGTYAVCYISNYGKPYHCINQFVRMVVHKYSYLDEFNIIIPEWVYFSDYFIDECSRYFGNIHIENKTGKQILNESTSKKKLVFRKDILPLPYKKMIDLYKFSVREILVTGDQSISDVIGLFWKEKLPFYQILDWKKNFSKNMMELLPHKYYKSAYKSCGKIGADKYNPNFKKFVDKYNFENIGKLKLDKLLKNISYAQK